MQPFPGSTRGYGGGYWLPFTECLGGEKKSQPHYKAILELTPCPQRDQSLRFFYAGNTGWE